MNITEWYSRWTQDNIKIGELKRELLDTRVRLSKVESTLDSLGEMIFDVRAELQKASTKDTPQGTVGPEKANVGTRRNSQRHDRRTAAKE